MLKYKQITSYLNIFKSILHIWYEVVSHSYLLTFVSSSFSYFNATATRLKEKNIDDYTSSSIFIVWTTMYEIRGDMNDSNLLKWWIVKFKVKC